MWIKDVMSCYSSRREKVVPGLQATQFSGTITLLPGTTQSLTLQLSAKAAFCLCSSSYQPRVEVCISISKPANNTKVEVFTVYIRVL